MFPGVCVAGIADCKYVGCISITGRWTIPRRCDWYSQSMPPQTRIVRQWRSMRLWRRHSSRSASHLGASSQLHDPLHRSAASRQSRLLRQCARANARHRRRRGSWHALRQPPDAEPDLLAEPGHDDHGAVSAPPRNDHQRAHHARGNRDPARAAVPGRLRHACGRQAAPATHHGRRLVPVPGVGALLEGGTRGGLERAVLRIRHRRFHDR